MEFFTEDDFVDFQIHEGNIKKVVGELEALGESLADLQQRVILYYDISEMASFAVVCLDAFHDLKWNELGPRRTERNHQWKALRGRLLAGIIEDERCLTEDERCPL